MSNKAQNAKRRNNMCKTYKVKCDICDQNAKLKKCRICEIRVCEDCGNLNHNAICEYCNNVENNYNL